MHALLEEVLDDPERNTNEYLEKKALDLASRPDEELRKLGEMGKEAKDEAENEELRDVLPKTYNRLEKSTLVTLLRIFSLLCWLLVYSHLGNAECGMWNVECGMRNGRAVIALPLWPKFLLLCA